VLWQREGSTLKFGYAQRTRWMVARDHGPSNLKTLWLITDTIQLGQIPITSISAIRGAIAKISRRLISIG
jgi:hypothetical protein